MIANPDRIALWAVVMAVVAMIAGVASADAGSGGVATSGDGSGSGCSDSRFGARTLELGDCGDDVRTLNWILRAKDLQRRTLAPDFESPTHSGVRTFQRRRDLPVTGVFQRRTRKKLTRSLPRQISTWYGPGFFGNRTACGQTLTRKTKGVAHRTLPCGSRVVIGYKGRWVRTRVIDRGPYANHARWDLTQKTARQLRFEYTDKVRVAKLSRR